MKESEYNEKIEDLTVKINKTRQKNGTCFKYILK